MTLKSAGLYTAVVSNFAGALATREARLTIKELFAFRAGAGLAATMRQRRRAKQKTFQLPPRVGRLRWSLRAKAAVVIALRCGTLSRSEAYELYRLSVEELAGWEAALDRDGIDGLRVRALACCNRRERDMLGSF